MTNDNKRIAVVCGACGSDKVSRDAWAHWSVKTQQWELGTVFDYGHCEKCGGESRLLEVELESSPPT